MAGPGVKIDISAKVRTLYLGTAKYISSNFRALTWIVEVILLLSSYQFEYYLMKKLSLHGFLISYIQCLENINYELTLEDVEAWESHHGQIQAFGYFFKAICSS